MHASPSDLRAGGEKSRGLKFAEACGSVFFSLKEISVKVPETNRGVSCWGRVCVLVTRTECVSRYWFPLCYSEGEIPFTTLSEAYYFASCRSTDAREVNCAFDGKCMSIAAAGESTSSWEG